MSMRVVFSSDHLAVAIDLFRQTYAARGAAVQPNFIPSFHSTIFVFPGDQLRWDILRWGGLALSLGLVTSFSCEEN